MKIPLSQGKVAIVGPKDYAYLIQWKWCYYNHHSNGGYAIRTDYTNGKRTVYMHRVILERKGFKNFANTDHRNRDKLDNQRKNLRPATVKQNQCNRDMQSNNTSGYKGVYWHKRDRNWQAYIQVNGKRIYLGYYDNLKEAAQAYNKAALKYHGEFARLNKV